LTFGLKDTEGMSLSVETGNSWYLIIGDFASICGGGSLVVFYGGEKLVSKNVSKCESGKIGIYYFCL